MPQEPIKSKPNVRGLNPERATVNVNTSKTVDIVDGIVNKINTLEVTEGLKAYPIRDLVEHAKEFGPYLKNQRLETNQIRKFLDAINRLKADLAEKDDFSKVETEVVLLKPKLAYAAARQKAAQPLSRVMSAAIDKVYSKEDFYRLVQLIESIIAYHKAEGGK